MMDPVADLLQRCAAGDRSALRELYRATSAKLMGVLLRILGERSEAEDALQEVLHRVWLRAHRFDEARGRGMTWLISVTRNHAIDRLRQRPDTAPDSYDDTLHAAVASAEGRIVARSERGARSTICLDTLEPARATALRGAYLEGLSYTELSERHAIPLNTLRSWLRRGLSRLRECMDQ